MSLRVVIVQHGDKERRPGDPGLTDLGWTQAVTTARWLASREAAVAIWSSPTRRAQQSATAIAGELDVVPRIDARLRERINWVDSEGGSIDDFVEEWRVGSADRSYVPRRGDSSFAAAARFLAALDDLATAHPTGLAVVVAHGGVTTDLPRTLLGDDELRARASALIDGGVPCCALTTLDATDDGWAVASIATANHLDNE